MVTKAVFTALLFVALLVSKCAYDHNRRLEGLNNLLQQQNAQLQDTLRRHVRARDTLYIRDTTVKWRVVQRAETLLTTLLKSDTVTLTSRESVIVFAADSAIQACRSIVASCESRIAVRDSLLTAITWDRNYWRGKGRPSIARQAQNYITTVGGWELLKAAVRAIAK